MEIQMISETFVKQLFSWFHSYVDTFQTTDQSCQINIDLKRDHTIRVCTATRIISESLDLEKNDIHLASICALLHDIGRFDQYTRYRTFLDAKSENHALLGVQIIQQKKILKGLSKEQQKIIEFSVSLHNCASLPHKGDERNLFFTKIIRDADKLDIFFLMKSYFKDKKQAPNRGIELDLPDIDFISEDIWQDLMDNKIVKIKHLKSLNDFKLMMISWIYDITFQKTFQIVREEKFIEALFDELPPTHQILQFKTKALHYLKNKAQ